MTTPLTFTIQIASVTYDIKEGSFDFNPQIEQRTKLTFTVLDPNNSFTFQKGQVITLTDSASTIQFTGTVHTSIKYKVGTGNLRQHDIDCNDLHQVADERSTNRIYTGQYAGVIFAGMTNDVLSGDGITANYAIRDDNTQADFGQGTLSGTMATPNLGGDLELALAGSPVTIVENSSSAFSSGTLTNCQVSGNSLVPTPTSAIKLQGTESLTQDGNAYIYMQFYASGSISIISGRYLEYDVFIDPTSPNGSVGIDIIMTDGSNLRDLVQDYRYRDVQNILPHPGNDIGGFAKGTWYHRKFLLDNCVGKTISHLDVVIEGNAQGTYTAYFKNILYTNGSGTTVNTFFNGTLNVNPPKKMQNSGYSNVSCSVVNTYDCITQVSQRVSPSYQIGNAGIAKNTFLSWVATQQTNTNVLVEYSLDGGNSYITCTNNAALPSLLAGLSLAGLSIQFRQTFQQLTGASPESQPMLSSMQVFLNPSYVATKSDVKLSATTNTEWNAGTFSSTQVNSGVLSLFGLVRNFKDNTDFSDFTLFGGGASGTGFSTVHMLCNLGTLWVQCGNSMEGHARYDAVGSWQNGRIESDVYFDRTDQRASIEYRRTNDSNWDANYAYAAEFNLNAVTLQRGSNSSASSNGTRTQVATASISIASASWHRVAMEFNGSNHKIWVDDALYINATDGTYTASGKVSLRVSNSNVSQGYQAQFNNFGITVIGMSGTWVSPVQSLTAAGTYGGSVVTWEDVSIGSQSTKVLVESTINGGSSWQTCTNGGPVPNLTLGQSLSGINLQLRATLSTQTATCMPQIQYLVARVMGGFSSSGTRIAPVLSLAPALVAGSTVANWSANTPPSTSIAVATSTDNITYTGVTNGGPIAGITTQPLPVLDTFATDSHTNYTSTFQSGGASGTWNFDTANSRVTIASGTAAVLLWSPVWFNTGYLNKKQITINHLQVVGGADLTNFNFPVSMIDANLATVANGGLVTNANGFDIIFVDATETTKLDHEIEKYVSSTGEIEMWVRIPTLSHTVDTVIYMYFNNSGISTSQENPTGVWDSNYKAVWHMDVATGANQNDSTSNLITATQHNSPVQGVGEIDGGMSFDGLADYFSVAHGSAADITGDKTIEAWINADSFSIDANGADPRVLINNIDGTNCYQFALDNAGGGTIGFAVNDSTGQHIIANQTSNINTWYHLVGTYVASTHAVALYINGVSVANNGSLSLALGTSSLFNIGRRTDALGYYLGSLDEVRVSNIVRTAGWIATTYNSQSNPDLFFSVGTLTIQSSINTKDVDVIIDADAINQGGLVWRWQNASNFYSIQVFDSASNAGSTNIIKLFKLVSNVTTQIGSNVAISFTRGDNHRFHVSMIGTAIKVYMDGVQLISTTDSSLAGPGQVGLIHVSGTGGNGDSYHNVRFQALGQSLSGVNAYTKVTLTSTDPTVTPQLTDLTLAALHPNIGLGAYVPTVDYTRTFFSANADDLAKKSDYYWQIDPNKNAIFSPRVEQPAPWILTSNDILFPDDGSPSTLSVENSGDLYRGRMILRGVLATQFTTETHPGDGSSTSWNLKLPVVGSAPIISVNNQAKTIGQKGIDTGKDFYYALGSTSLAQDASGTLLQPNVDSFTISYTGQSTIDVVRDNTGGFPGTTTQAQYAALTGGSGIVEVVEDVSSQQMTVAAAQTYGDSQLQRYGVIGRTFTCMTNRTGLSVGQYIPVFVPELGLSDASMLITAMDLKPEITLVGSQVSMLYYWTLTLVEGPNLGSWQKTLLQAFT